MEKGDFERKWSNAFEGAEVSPSDAVWTNVELDLERAAGGKMKKRILFYKMLAAASLVFAMGVAGVYYLQVTPEVNSMTARQNQEGMESSTRADATSEANALTEASSAPSAIPNTSSKQDTPISNNQSIVEKVERSGLTDQSSSTTSNQQVRLSGNNRNNQGMTEQKLVATNNNNEQKQDEGILKSDEVVVFQNINNALNNRKLPSLIVVNNPTLVIAKKESESTADPGMVLLAKLKDEEKKYAEEDKKKSKQEELWTSVAFGAGTFNPNSGNGTMIQSNSLGGSSTNINSNPSTGSSFSFGVQVGGKITDRLVLQGGISYLTQNASYMSNIASMESASLKASLNDFAYSSSNQAITTSPYSVNSNLQYISVPTQLGYVLVDRKFAIQINGGVATDIFIVNTLTPDADNVSKVSQGSGEDSPYRPVLFSGLVGTEFSYRFSDRYRIAVNPGFRYALNSMYKAEVSAEASPITYDVALRFRYIFK
jgi:hypothetical protein